MAARASVFTTMAIKRKHSRTPRLLADRRSSASIQNDFVQVTAKITRPSFEGMEDPQKVSETIDPQDPLPAAIEASRHLVRYFDDRGGFWRVGRLIDSHTVTRGRHKGRVILTIESALHQRLTRNIDEVEKVQ